MINYDSQLLLINLSHDIRDKAIFQMDEGLFIRTTLKLTSCLNYNIYGNTEI